jgi:hypothetical protein
VGNSCLSDFQQLVGFICSVTLSSAIFTLELGALGFAMPYSAAVAALGVWAVRAHMTVFMAAIAFDIRAVFSRVPLLHHSTVSARFRVWPNNHFDQKWQTVSYLWE